MWSSYFQTSIPAKTITAWTVRFRRGWQDAWKVKTWSLWCENEADSLMIAVNYFQLQKVTLGGFSEYHCLMDECRPQCKIGSVLQQLLHELFVKLLYQHGWQRVQNPHILWRLPPPPYIAYPSPFFIFCLNSFQSPPTLLFLLISLTEWVTTPHLICHSTYWHHGSTHVDLW